MRGATVTLVVLALALTTACGSDDQPTSAPTSTGTTAAPAPTGSSSPATPLPAAGSTLAPGRYARTGFTPAVSFKVGNGWVAEQRAPGFFDVQQDVGSPDVIAVQLTQVTAYDRAADAAASFADVEHVVAGPVEPVTIGGLEGVRVLVETDDPADADPPVFRDVITVPAGPLAIASGRRLLVHLVDTPDGVLGVLVGGSITEWERTLAVAQPVLESMIIG